VPRFEPKNPDYRTVAIATFEAQQAVHTLGLSIARLEPGEVDLAMAYDGDLSQQNGFVHALIGCCSAALCCQHGASGNFLL
jgi:acyl-coenzyme A thioesterase PaaI-like protein